MDVSIIIPVYNAEKYLKECLDSAINQTYSDYEIIAVNDGSIDNSLEILQNYSDKIKIITKKNGGSASAMNVGIKKASGQWIKRLDSDDILYPAAIEKLVSEAKKLEDKKNIILYSNFETIDSNGSLIDQVIEPNFNNIDPFNFNVMLLDHNIGNGNTLLIHKSTFSEYGLYHEDFLFEDYELMLRYCILYNCRMKLIPTILAKYRIHSHRKTKLQIKISLEETNEIRKAILSKLNESKRLQYQKALKQYKKNKPLIEKGKYYVRYHLFKILPTFFSNSLLDAYWYTRKRKK